MGGSIVMAETWLIRVYNDHVLAIVQGVRRAGRAGAPGSAGRRGALPGQRAGRRRLSDRHRAPSDDLKISRRHARVEEIAPDRVLVRNISNNNSIVFEDGYQLRPGAEREADLPVVLRIGAKVVRINWPRARRPGVVDPEPREPTAAPGSDGGWVGTSTHQPRTPPGRWRPRACSSWLKAMIRVLHSAANDADFFQKAAQAVVEVVGLDMGRVLIRDGDDWQTAAFYPSGGGRVRAEQSAQPLGPQPGLPGEDPLVVRPVEDGRVLARASPASRRSWRRRCSLARAR